MFEILKKQKVKKAPSIKISQETIAQDNTGRWRCDIVRYHGFNADKSTIGLMVQMQYIEMKQTTC